MGNKTEFASYSFDVKAEGEGVVRHMDMTTMNNRNTIGLNLGAPATANELNLKAGEVKPIYTLRFEFIDELGQPVHGLNYYRSIRSARAANLSDLRTFLFRNEGRRRRKQNRPLLLDGTRRFCE